MIIDKIEIGGIILMDINKSDMLRGLYGSKISRNKCVGYCYLHKCHLTAKTLKRHECLKKQCNCLKKHEENYALINQFSDGKNAQRIYDELIKNGLI